MNADFDDEPMSDLAGAPERLTAMANYFDMFDEVMRHLGLERFLGGVNEGEEGNMQRDLRWLARALCDRHDWYRGAAAPPDVCLRCGATEDQG